MESSGRTLVCSVLFLDIVEYSKKPVAEQLQLKQAFNAALGRGARAGGAARPHHPRHRRRRRGHLSSATRRTRCSLAMLDARRGAHRCRVRMGVNLGPVRLVKDLNGQMNIIGDGINVAQRVMSFAEPGQLLVSRSFYEVVSCLSRDYANLFRHEGARTDKHVREHEVYSVVGGTPARAACSRHAVASLGRANGSAGSPAYGPLGLRRSALVAAPALFLARSSAACGRAP